MINAVFFDFGGTLDTDGIHWSERFWDIYQEFGLNIIKKDYEYAYVESEKRIGGDNYKIKSFFDVLYLQISCQFDVLKEQGVFQNIDKDLLDKMVKSCYEDVRKTMNSSKHILELLSSKYTLGIISNFYGNLKQVCKEFGIDSYITLFIDSKIVGLKKPDPAIYKLAVNSLHSNPEDLVMIGDSYDRDISPAKSVGMKTIWLKGRSWKEYSGDYSDADYIINSLAQLKNIDLLN
ncbi:MAG TPA: HAD family hydrolase [Bacteroidota bacterium]|nr:HAD family hydrolase [Bacteroidota bacterium]